jgi:multidrug efflux pump subunit AcrB
MWLVNAALRNPYAVYVGILLAVVLGVVAYRRTPTDILPYIRQPVVVVFASYRGMPAPDMEQSVTAVLERALTRCDHLEHLESRSLLGIGIIRVYFRSQVDPDVAASQVISLVNGEMQNLPPGMLPPSILKYDASAVPVGNLIIASTARNDKELLDLADHEIREELATIEGLASAPVFGGVFRQVQIYVHPRTLEALRLAPMDVARIVNSQSQIVPTGEMRIGAQNYYIASNSMVADPDAFAKIPLWSDGRKVVYLGDVANVVDATRWRTNTVHVDGKRAVYMPLLRQAGASAITVVDNVKEFLPQLHARGRIPDDVTVEVAFDQSQYVRDALANLREEAVLGAVLASLVVLLFLGSLRVMWIVALSIPLSILAALVGLYFTGQTLNIMTLGGLALILGRVLDDSIVDVENTVRHLNMGKDPLTAARDSAGEISVPVLMATITTVVVFFPLSFMAGVGKYLFTPLAVSATLAMAASYIVSRTVSPLLCSQTMRAHSDAAPERFPRWLFLAALLVATPALLLILPALQKLPLVDRLLPEAALDVLAQPFLALPGWLQQVIFIIGAVSGLTIVAAIVFWCALPFERFFDSCTRLYERVLRFALRRRIVVYGALAALFVPAGLAFLQLGQELFPEVDASELTIHLRATGGPRVEVTEEQTLAIDRLVREVVPPEDVVLTLGNIGLSSRWSAVYTPNNGPHAAFLRVQLRSGFAGRTTPTIEYVEKLRQRLDERFPGDAFYFETGGMIRQILNSGAMAPIVVQVHGRDMETRRAATRLLDAQIAQLPQVRDTYMPQDVDLPQLTINVDRIAAARLGLTQVDAVQNVVAALMSSAQIAPNFWIDPVSGNPYFIGVQYPERLVTDVRTLENIPLSRGRSMQRGPTRVPLLKEVAHIERTQAPVEIYRHDIDRVSEILVSVGGNDLAGTATSVDALVARLPLDYALDQLPPSAAHHAADADFRAAIAAYLEHGDPALRDRIRQDYGVRPDTLKLPPGLRATVRGEIRSMRESFREMVFNLLLAVVLVYLIMAAQFGSWLDPFIMIVAAPLALIGVALFLWMTGTSVNIQSCMGVLLLVGISVSNSVLMVEFANRQRGAGLGRREAIVSAACTRLRPILMTTAATIAGLLPMAMHLQPGDEMNLPLARAVIGGLIGSTLLTLFVVPVLYQTFKPRHAL